MLIITRNINLFRHLFRTSRTDAQEERQLTSTCSQFPREKFLESYRQPRTQGLIPAPRPTGTINSGYLSSFWLGLKLK